MGLGTTSSLLWNRRPTDCRFSVPDDTEVRDDAIVTLVSDVRFVGLRTTRRGGSFDKATNVVVASHLILMTWGT